MEAKQVLTYQPLLRVRTCSTPGNPVLRTGVHRPALSPAVPYYLATVLTSSSLPAGDKGQGLALTAWRERSRRGTGLTPAGVAL